MSLYSISKLTYSQPGPTGQASTEPSLRQLLVEGKQGLCYNSLVRLWLRELDLKESLMVAQEFNHRSAAKPSVLGLSIDEHKHRSSTLRRHGGLAV